MRLRAPLQFFSFSPLNKFVFIPYHNIIECWIISVRFTCQIVPWYLEISSYLVLLWNECPLPSLWIYLDRKASWIVSGIPNTTITNIIGVIYLDNLRLTPTYFMMLAPHFLIQNNKINFLTTWMSEHPISLES